MSATKIMLQMRTALGGAIAVVILSYSLPLPGQSSTENLPMPESVLAAHRARVMKMLPLESGTPPLVDLSKNYPPGADQKWEALYTGSMGVRPILDPGVHSMDEATSMSLTTTDGVGAYPALPVRNSTIVAVGVPLASSAYLARNSRFVYSLYQNKLEEILKDDRKKQKGEAADPVLCGELGGSVRFLSGHVGTFLAANYGFLKLSGRYVLFLWQPNPCRRISL